MENNINHYQMKILTDEPMINQEDVMPFDQTDFQIILKSQVPQPMKQELIDLYSSAKKRTQEDWIRGEMSLINAQVCQQCDKKFKLSDTILKLEHC